MESLWHHIPESDVIKHLSTSKHHGLSREAAAALLLARGPNVLPQEKPPSVLIRIWRQFQSPLVYILLFAGIFTLLLREYLDTVVIAVALLINVIVSLLQEERASKAFEKLRASQVPHALVIRDGRRQRIKAADVVVGDIVVLDAGYAIPADVRILSAKELKVNEAALTGESDTVTKHPDAVPKDAPLAERYSMGFMGTLVISGKGVGVVVAVGVDTEVGKIAKTLGLIDSSITPLQRYIEHIARFLTRVIVAVTTILFFVGMFRGEPISDMLLLAVAVAVATMPSGLPAAVTVVLALGMEAILKRGGLVRNLLAAETLGSTTVILTDKTGTLTQASMTLTEVHTFESFDQTGTTPVVTKDDHALILTATLAADAFVDTSDRPERLVAHGNPIEKAVVIAGLEAGYPEHELSVRFPRIDAVPFSSERRFAASLNDVVDGNGAVFKRIVCVNGAPELLLIHATHLYKEGNAIVFTKNLKAKFAALQARKSREGMRLIGVATKEVAWDSIPKERDRVLHQLTFLGFMVFTDPVRSDVPESISLARAAGARVIMLTGDNADTAVAVAIKAGLIAEHERASTLMLGDATEALDDHALAQALMGSVRVIARATPSHKLRLARILQAHGEVVAMTGDGINDALALRAATIGVAVGSGTEVAKESSDLVLINDSFSIIVAAIEEGRRIIDNLKKIVTYLLSTSVSEIFIISGALMMGAPLPLLPSQILWAKIIEEGLMSFSFAFERGDPHAMKRDPRSPEFRAILTTRLKLLLLVVSGVTGVFLIILFSILLAFDVPIEEIRTVMFVALSLDAIFFTFSLKSLDVPLWRINPFGNRYLLYALAASVTLLFLALTLPPLQALLSLTPLPPVLIAALIAAGLFNLLTIEVAKYIFFMRGRSMLLTR